MGIEHEGGARPPHPLTCLSSGARRFICRACQVLEPEERFAMDEYSDMVAVAKPVVYITMGELVNTHRVRACASSGQWVDGLALEGGPGSNSVSPLLPPSGSCCWNTRTGSPLITETPCTSSWRTLGSCPLSLTLSVSAILDTGAGGQVSRALEDALSSFCSVWDVW